MSHCYVGVTTLPLKFTTFQLRTSLQVPRVLVPCLYSVYSYTQIDTITLSVSPTVSSPTFPPPPLSVPVSVTEVECVREGCQSEALRRLSGSVPENQCFTVVFRGARKSLDLLCSSEEEARHWVRGIRTLKERVANMTQKEKLDQYPLPPPVGLCCAVPGCQLSTQGKYSAGWAARIAMVTDSEHNTVTCTIRHP